MLAWAEAIDRPRDYKPWPRPEPRRRSQRAADASSRCRASSSGGAIPTASMPAASSGCKPLDPLEAELGRGRPRHRHCTTRSTSSCRRIPSGAAAGRCALHRFEAHRRAASRRSCWPRRPSAPSGGRASSGWRAGSWPPRRARRAAGARCWAARQGGRSSTARVRSRIEARADRIDEIEPTAAGRSSTTRPAACPQPRSSKACSRRSCCSRRRWPQRGGFREIDGKAAGRAAVLSGSANGLRRRRRDRRGRRTATELVPAMLALLAQDGRRTSPIPATPYPPCPMPEFIPHFNDYAHLGAGRRMVDGGRRRGMSGRSRQSASSPSSAAAPRDIAGHVGLGRGQCRHRQDQGADRPGDAPAARRRAARAHPLPHLHQGGGRRDAQPPGGPARPLGACRRRDARQGDQQR